MRTGFILFSFFLTSSVIEVSAVHRHQNVHRDALEHRSKRGYGKHGNRRTMGGSGHHHSQAVYFPWKYSEADLQRLLRLFQSRQGSGGHLRGGMSRPVYHDSRRTLVFRPVETHHKKPATTRHPTSNSGIHHETTTTSNVHNRPTNLPTWVAHFITGSHHGSTVNYHGTSSQRSTTRSPETWPSTGVTPDYYTETPTTVDTTTKISSSNPHTLSTTQPTTIHTTHSPSTTRIPVTDHGETTTNHSVSNGTISTTLSSTSTHPTNEPKTTNAYTTATPAESSTDRYPVTVGGDHPTVIGSHPPAIWTFFSTSTQSPVTNHTTRHSVSNGTTLSSTVSPHPTKSTSTVDYKTTNAYTSTPAVSSTHYYPTTVEVSHPTTAKHSVSKGTTSTSSPTPTHPTNEPKTTNAYTTATPAESSTDRYPVTVGGDHPTVIGSHPPAIWTFFSTSTQSPVTNHTTGHSVSNGTTLSSTVSPHPTKSTSTVDYKTTNAYTSTPAVSSTHHYPTTVEVSHPTTAKHSVSKGTTSSTTSSPTPTHPTKSTYVTTTFPTTTEDYQTTPAVPTSSQSTHDYHLILGGGHPTPVPQVSSTSTGKMTSEHFHLDHGETTVSYTSDYPCKSTHGSTTTNVYASSTVPDTTRPVYSTTPAVPSSSFNTNHQYTETTTESHMTSNDHSLIYTIPHFTLWNPANRGTASSVHRPSETTVSFPSTTESHQTVPTKSTPIHFTGEDSTTSTGLTTQGAEITTKHSTFNPEKNNYYPTITHDENTGWHVTWEKTETTSSTPLTTAKYTPTSSAKPTTQYTTVLVPRVKRSTAESISPKEVLSQYMSRALEEFDKETLLGILSTLEEEYLSRSRPEEAEIIRETFDQLRTTVMRAKKGEREEEWKEYEDEWRIKRATKKQKAAAMLELLEEDEEDSYNDDDVRGGGLYDDDPMYDEYYYYEDEASTIDEGPSLLELVSLASKHNKSDNFDFR